MHPMPVRRLNESCQAPAPIHLLIHYFRWPLVHLAKLGCQGYCIRPSPQWSGPGSFAYFWAEIRQFALVGSSSSLLSEACNTISVSRHSLAQLFYDHVRIIIHYIR